jgi:hypothetical protein
MPAEVRNPMSDTPSPAADATVVDAHAPDHATGHGDDSHGPERNDLGPFDVVMWTFAIVAVMLGILIWAALAIATTSI